jgi:hypothetical protein
MTEEDFTGNKVNVKAQGGADASPSGARNVRGEGFEDPYERLSARRSKSTNTKTNNVDQAIDKREPHEAGSYEGIQGANLRNLMQPGDVADEAYRYYVHEGDLKNAASYKEKGILDNWDPAEEGRKFVSAREGKGEGDIPKDRVRVRFRSKEEPQRSDIVNTVKFRKAIPPEDIVGIDYPHQSTLDKLAHDLYSEGTPEGHGRFVPKYEPGPKPEPHTPPHLNTRGPKPPPAHPGRRI